MIALARSSRYGRFLAAEEPGYVTSQAIAVDGGFTCVQ